MTLCSSGFLTRPFRYLISSAKTKRPTINQKKLFIKRFTFYYLIFFHKKRPNFNFIIISVFFFFLKKKGGPTR